MMPSSQGVATGTGLGAASCANEGGARRRQPVKLTFPAATTRSILTAMCRSVHCIQDSFDPKCLIGNRQGVAEVSACLHLHLKQAASSRKNGYL